MALTENGINNISTHYARENNMWENLVYLAEIFERHGNNTFYIYRKLCQIKTWHLVSNPKQLACEIPNKKEQIFLRKLSKPCFIKVIKRKKITMPLQSQYNDEVLFTIVVYK